MNCRHCHAPLDRLVIDLGHQPPSNAYIEPEDLERPEVYAPLKVYVCEKCFLVQVSDVHRADELFTPSYAYFSSVSASWVRHAERYAGDMIERFGLGPDSFVAEIASNDGYLLQFFKSAGIPSLGIEPTAATAAAARARGIDTIEEFFGEAAGQRLARERRPADLIAANNVVAHVPDINDFVAGFRELLGPSGVATFEFPHLLRLVTELQFDTIYHEHYSYLSLHTIKRVLERQRLAVFDVEEIPTHGGSLRVFACHADEAAHRVTPKVAALLEREKAAGMLDLAFYETLRSRALDVKLGLLSFLIEQKRAGKVVAAYGAAAKGNTLLNYAGVAEDLIAFVCDAAPSKQGRLMPGSRIPILPPAALRERKPDYVLILPWNIKDEILATHDYIRDWSGRFLVAVPELRLL